MASRDQQADSANKLEALRRYIQHCSGAIAARVLEFRQLSGGAIQENHGLRIELEGGTLPGEYAFVVRCDAPSVLSVSLSRAQEFHVLSAAYEGGLTVPRPYWLCTDRSLIGSDFYVMQWAEGSASARELVKGLDAAQRKALVFRLGQEMARLHQIRPPRQSLDFLALPEQSPAQQRINEYRNRLAAVTHVQLATEFMLAWLQRHIPSEQDCVLCHCDFRSGNYLVQDGQLTGLLDWEFATWSDPYEDLGWLCARSWRFGEPAREAGGIGDKEDLFAGYASISGWTPDPKRVAYWEVMASVRWAVIAALQAQRHLLGEQESLELLLTGYMCAEIQLDGLAHLREADSALAAQPRAREVQWEKAATPAAKRADGAALLAAARSLLLSSLLPDLHSADQQYDARMIANAMAVANREITLGREVCEREHNAIGRYYAKMGLSTAGRDEASLVDDIRARRFDAEMQPGLFTLIEHLMQLKLLLSNPKRLNQA